MGCGGCEECAPGHWHLHVTVDRDDPSETGLWRGTSLDIDCERLGARKVGVTNLIWDEGPYAHLAQRSYRELIPTIQFRGTEAEATDTLIVFCHHLLRWDYRIVRAKIEGDPALVSYGRALYYETHVKFPNAIGLLAGFSVKKLAVSRPKKEYVYVTFRRRTITELCAVAGPFREEYATWIIGQPRTEACVLDTNEKMDEAWLAQGQ